MPSSSWRHTSRECGLEYLKLNVSNRRSAKLPSRRGRDFSESLRRDYEILPADWVSSAALVMLLLCFAFLSRLVQMVYLLFWWFDARPVEPNVMFHMIWYRILLAATCFEYRTGNIRTPRAVQL